MSDAPRETALVRKTVVVLRTVAMHPDGVGLSELARLCGMPKATCYRILRTLEEETWLARDSANRYRVSPGMLLMLGSLLDQGSERSDVLQILRTLSAEVGETAGLDQLIAPSVMVTAQVQGPRVISFAAKAVPRLLPPWTTSTGKVLLAWTEPEVVRAAYGADHADRGPSGSLEDFLDGLELVRRDGYGFAYDEMEEGLAAVAAPVRVGAAVPYAIWVSGPSYRIARERIPEIAVPLRAAAGELSRILRIRGLAAGKP
jgi:DNA-binding IclR family transcriptional regulator